MEIHDAIFDMLARLKIVLLLIFMMVMPALSKTAVSVICCMMLAKLHARKQGNALLPNII
ncbi:MAG: hypothetical protein D6711_08485 [Chloroflexi bacterium]|nr:MAG: hypothetical protein D6711_08485 [Chloroflexota bacterium]